MRTEVYINDYLIDISEEETITASYGNLSFGDWYKRKGVKSNTWKAPFSPPNKLAFESCEVEGSFSDIPYRRGVIRVELDGVIVFEGFCYIEEATEEYEILSFAGASDFYSTINKKKLTELDLSEWDHIWNEPNIRNSWNNVEGYIYAFVEYGKGNPFYLEGLPPSFFFPQLFFHTLIKQIATDAGYTLTGDVLESDRFLKHLVLANKFPVAIQYGGDWDLTTLLPDLTQSKMWLDFANIYGLIFDINELTKEIRCNYIDDILFNDPEDWTGKIDYSKKARKKFRYTGLGQVSKFRYKYEELTPTTPVYQDFAKDAIVDDHNLDPEVDVYKSEFHLIQDADPILDPDGRAVTFTFVAKPDRGYSGIWNASRSYPVSKGVVWYNGTYYEPIAASLGNNPSTSPTFWKVVAEKDVWDMKSRAMYGTLITDVGSEIIIAFSTPATVTRIVSNTNMDWPYIYQHHYRVFDRIIDHTKIIEPLVKLSYADINQLDFTKAKKINNELYVLEEVKQFKLNEKESTLVTLIRI
jgi:hypothetical protein